MRDDFAPGELLGKYELVATIGGGGFASVWRARSVGLGGFEREVAIKVIRQGRASVKRFQDMLLDEARIVARIQHPNVAQIWEVGEDPRSLYFVMELVDGDSLDELAMRAEALGKQLPVRAVARVLADACAGLHAAHELEQDGRPLGIVHRDVSPQNILVSRSGIAKLIDFGIAKARERLAPDTTTGYIKGKISFMAPEQARSEEVDRRADVWGMGAVAYELIEGRPPVEGATDIGRLAALVGADRIRPMGDRAPEALRRVIERALEKDPGARHATALALKEALEEAMIESELETTAEEASRLLGPYFHRPGPRMGSLPDAAEPDADATLATTVEALGPEVPGPREVAAASVGHADEAPRSHSAERAVSSSIPRAVTDVIELPRRPTRWPFALAIIVLAPLGVWALFRAGANEGSSDLKDVTASQAPSSSPGTGLPLGQESAGVTSAPAPHPSVPQLQATTAMGSSVNTALAAPSVAASASPATTARATPPRTSSPTAAPNPRAPASIDPDAIE